MIATDPKSATRFADTMKAFTSTPEYSVSFIVNSYDWETLGKARIVDVGGSEGHVAMALTRSHPKLEVIVQDLEVVTEEAAETVPKDLKGRVSFMPHDFFTTQPAQADVYLLRLILHNWPDKYCLKILRSLVPVLRPWTLIIINEICMPDHEASIPLWKERDLRYVSEFLNSSILPYPV